MRQRQTWWLLEKWRQKDHKFQISWDKGSENLSLKPKAKYKQKHLEA
jgi:hypothetical protein